MAETLNEVAHDAVWELETAVEAEVEARLKGDSASIGWLLGLVNRRLAARNTLYGLLASSPTAAALDKDAEIARLREALELIAETTMRQQLPITAQVHGIARAALTQGKD